MAQPIPRPFEDASLTNPSGNNYSRSGTIVVNGQNINVSIYEESDSARWTFNLPSGDTALHEITLDSKGQFDKGEVSFKDSSGRTYTYSYDKTGAQQFTRKDTEYGQKTVLTESAFKDLIKGIIGPYDPKYMQFFEASLAKARTQQTNPLDGIKHGQTIRITTDGIAAVMEEVRPHQTPIAMGTFLNGARETAKVTSQNFNNEPAKHRWRGNEWHPALYDALKGMPKEDRVKLERAMNAGGIILEVNELQGKPVCQALAGKPKKGEPDVCKR